MSDSHLTQNDHPGIVLCQLITKPFHLGHQLFRLIDQGLKLGHVGIHLGLSIKSRKTVLRMQEHSIKQVTNQHVGIVLRMRQSSHSCDHGANQINVRIQLIHQVGTFPVQLFQTFD